MFDAILDWLLALLVFLGGPALFVLFVLKGALIGKPIPTSVILPGYILAVSGSRRETIGIILLTTSAYVLGQLIIYTIARREGLSAIRSSPRVSISTERLEQTQRWFDTYGGAGVFVTNFVPYLRGLILLPAGVAHYPVPRLVFFAFTSTLLYHTAIVAAAVGIVRIVW